MSRASEIDQLETDVRYYHDRIALLRAKLYRWGLGRTPRLQTLERQLAYSERRLREVRLRPER